MSDEFLQELMRRWRTLTALFNQVLARIGEKRITSADDTGDSAQVLRDEYPQALDQILAVYPWTCATRRKALAQKEGDNLTDYAYMFQIPADCVTVQALIDGDSKEILPYDCIIEGDTLYCNTENLVIRYTKRIEFYEMDSLLVEAFVLLLAHKVAWRITQSVDIENDMYGRYQIALQEAANADGVEKARRFNAQIADIDGWRMDEEDKH